MLSRHLHVDEVDIDSISQQYHGDLKEAAFKALLKLVVLQVHLYVRTC